MATETGNAVAPGWTPKGPVHRNLSPARLYEETLRAGLGRIAQGGALVTETTPHTGRSPEDRYIVRNGSSAEDVDWGSVNIPFDEGEYAPLKQHVVEYLEGRPLYVRDALAGADDRYQIEVRVVSESPWHDLFAYNMLRRLPAGHELGSRPRFTVYHAPFLEADPARHGTRSGAFVVVDFARREVLIGGTAYAGEIKKSVFSILNFRLPAQGVLPMHCSANAGADGDAALFFGLSGTGKTTLSAAAGRRLIGDDEHGWSHDGIFNFEGGCYAKTIRLSPQGEPGIYRTTRMFGTILENVALDENTREVDYDCGRLTENTRASYPVHFMPDSVPGGRGGHPRHVFFLTADAFGVLPPVAKLDAEQAMYHFLSGYTAKVAGTERGVTEPKATFSACFGAPFLPRPPTVYADLLREKIRAHGAKVWLVNTGWTAGGFGVGKRIELEHTRAMVEAALGGALDDVPVARDPAFGLSVPVRVPGVPDAVLSPRATWPDAEDYDRAARRLASMFSENFARFGGESSAAAPVTATGAGAARGAP